MSGLSLTTPLTLAPKHGFARMGARDGAASGAGGGDRLRPRDAGEATVEDLLNYLPMRYGIARTSRASPTSRTAVEVRWNFTFASRAAFRSVRTRPKAPPLFIFEVTASDPERTSKPRSSSGGSSGRQARRIVAYNSQRFTRGARFVAFGKWEWDSRRNTFALRLGNRRVEMLPARGPPPENALIRLAEAERLTQSGGTLATP